MKKFKMRHRRAFTLVELLVVMTIILTFVSLGVYNIRGVLASYKASQAAELISAVIRNVRSFAMQAEVDISNKHLWHNGSPTRLSSGVYFFKGWVNEEDLGDASAMADGNNDESRELSFSILKVTDIGFDTVGRRPSPDVDVEVAAVDSLTSVADKVIRGNVLNLPEGVVLRFSGNADTDTATSGTLLPETSYISYNQFGMINKKLGDAPVEQAFYSKEFSGMDCYLAVSYELGGAGGSEGRPYEGVEPIYIDLRTGDIIKNVEKIATLNFGSFE